MGSSPCSLWGLVAVGLVGAAADVVELVALQPTQGNMVTTTMEWAQMTMPDVPTSVDDVTLVNASGNAALGEWDELDLGTQLMLTGKRYGDKFYGLINTGKVEASGSCCADTLRAWDKDSGDYTDIDLTVVLAGAFNDVNNAKATHTLDLEKVDGELVAFVMGQYTADEINAPVDAVFAFKLSDGSVVQTVDGDNYYSMWAKLGTTSTDPADSIYKIQHYAQTDGGGQEWHGNGVERFTMADGTNILAVTQKELNSAALLSDPWTLSSADGGGEILQRFGTPSGQDDGISHTFGLNTSDVFAGVHNVYYSLAPSGRESVTIFVNGKSGSSDSWVYEFDINLVPESTITDYVDTVFDTTFRGAACGFVTDTQGGARPLGQTDGQSVWLVATGSASKGLYVVDEAGGYKNYRRDAALYDPFTFIVTSSNAPTTNASATAPVANATVFA